ncbi:hypothetical protein BH23CHL2_BH23CHL2_16110 [soil metagenome]
MGATGHHTARCLLALAFSFVALALTSCVQVEFRSDFERDGTSLHTLSVVVPRDMFEAAEDEGAAEAFNEISSRAADAGLTASRIITAETVTMRISTERPDGEDAGAALNNLLNATGINQDPGISAPFSGFFRQQTAAVGGSNFVLEMKIDGELLYDAAASTDIASEENRNRIEENLTIHYRVTVPGNVEDSTGVELEPGTLEWSVAPDAMVDARTVTSAGDSDRAALFVAAAIVSAVGVVVLAASVGWVLVRRPNLATSIATAASHFPRRTTITGEGLWVSRRVRRIVVRFWNRSAPHDDLPVRHDLLEMETEGGDDGADAEGDRPAAGVHGS